MATTNADGSVSSNVAGWLDNLFGTAKQAADVYKGWKELVDPVKAASTPSLGTGSASVSNGVIANASSGQAALNKQPFQVTQQTLWYVLGGLVLLLVIVVLKRKK